MNGGNLTQITDLQALKFNTEKPLNGGVLSGSSTILPSAFGIWSRERERGREGEGEGDHLHLLDQIE